MGWIVEYLDRKTFTLARSPVYGNKDAADRYALTVRNGKVVPSTVSAPSVDVTKVPDAAVVDAQRARDLDAQIREHETEAYAEAGSQARLYGASTSEALDAARDAEAIVRDVMSRPVIDALDPRVREIEIICANCGKRRPRPGMSVCFTCQKRL